MDRVFLGLGSNLGDRYDNLQQAIRLISSIPEINLVKSSSIYETKPFGYLEQPNFLNMVIEINTSLKADELLKTILNIEKDIGRIREKRWGPRIIDIDILLYGNDSIDSEDLKVPHPYICERLFVLIPLKEIYNGRIPNSSQSIEKMINDLDNNKGEDVVKWRG